MEGEFTPGKMIMRDFVQIILLFLIFSPISELVKGFSFKGFELSYIISLLFLVLCLIFLYHILINLLKIFNSNMEKLTMLFKGSVKNEH
jgi:signal transduction histidine kinase